MDRRVLGLLVAGLVAGCGGDDRSSAPPAAGETTAPAVEEQPQERRDPDEQAVAEVAQRYLDALSSGDYDAACETRTTKEQRELARLAGSCP